jgi:hypothetical protein
MNDLLHKKLEEIVSLKDEINKLHFKIEKLEKKCSDLQTENRAVKAKSFHSLIEKRIKKTSYFMVSDDLQNRWKRKIKKAFFDLGDDALQLYNLRISKIVLHEKSHATQNQINDQKLEIIKFEKQDTKNIVQKCLFFKDKYLVSDFVYRALQTNISSDLPPLNSIIRYRNYLNNLFEFKYFENGIFVNIQDKIKTVVKSFILKNLNFEEVDLSAIKIKLSADGTQIGRFIKIINITFTIINDTKKAKTASGNYTLGIIYCRNNDESYETLKLFFPYLIEEIRNFNNVEFEEKKYPIDYYFTSDWVMMAEVCGLYNPSSNHPCIWCTQSKKDFSLAKKSSDRTFLTDHEIKNLIRNDPKHNHHGYKHESLLSDVIPFKKCIVDMLHLFIRISETLLQGLTKQLALRDNFKKNSKDISNYPNISRYFNFLEQKCKVKVFFNESSWTEKKSLLHRNLTGKEKRRIFNNIDFVNTFPDLFENDDDEKKKLKKYEQVWKKFNEIILFIKKNREKSNAGKIKSMTENWLKIFLDFHFADDITPYIHVLCNHMHEFVEENGNVNVYNVEGLEKLNDISTMEFFKSTNKWIDRGSSFIKQMMQRRARLDFIENDFL